MERHNDHWFRFSLVVCFSTSWRIAAMEMEICCVIKYIVTVFRKFLSLLCIYGRLWPYLPLVGILVTVYCHLLWGIKWENISFILLLNEFKPGEYFLMHLVYFSSIATIYARIFIICRYYILQSKSTETFYYWFNFRTSYWRYLFIRVRF